jgi:hypothetical protein
VGNSTGIVGTERSHGLEGLRQDSHDSIGAAEEDTLGSRDDRGDVPRLWGQRERAVHETERAAGRHTSEKTELSWSGSLTWVTSKNLNCHCEAISNGIMGMGTGG